ncbi:hypothetical protein [Streptomyces sp. NPDC002386]
MTDATIGTLLVLTFVRLYSPPKTLVNTLCAVLLLAAAALVIFTSGGSR